MFLEILLKILSIFLLVGIGYFVYKIRLVPYDALTTLNAFVLNVAVPCMILQSMQRNELNDKIFNDIIWSLAAFAIVTIVIAVIATLVINRIKSIPEEDKGIYSVQLAFTNCGFMGYPLTTVMFGQYGLFLAIIMNIIFTTFMYSIGVVMLLHKKGEKLFTMKLMVRMLSVPFLSSIAGLLIFISGFHFPSFIDSTLQLMAATVSPVAMFIVGINLSNSKIKEIFTPRNLILCVISLIVVPFFTLGVDMLLPVSNFVMVVHVFLMAMPSAAITTILCNRYNKNAKFAAEGVASTTFFSLGTLALWTFFLTELFL
ncbi:MAG: AEC family transporter [Clostridiales bacterium]|nr:AEC family transporter [Clostridiales bacterium]